MNATEISHVLAKAAAFDQRKVGQADILAWLEAIGDLDAGDALAAVTRHYQAETSRIMPADVRRNVIEIRNARATQRHSDALALPSRFEPDALRDITLRAGVAHCRDVIGPIVERLRAAREAQNGELSPSEERLQLARKRAREMHRERAMAERFGR